MGIWLNHLLGGYISGYTVKKSKSHQKTDITGGLNGV